MILDTLRNLIDAAKQGDEKYFIQARDFLKELLHSGDVKFTERMLWIFVKSPTGTKVFTFIRAKFSRKFRNKIFVGL